MCFSSVYIPFVGISFVTIGCPFHIGSEWKWPTHTKRDNCVLLLVGPDGPTFKTEQKALPIDVTSFFCTDALIKD